MKIPKELVDKWIHEGGSEYEIAERAAEYGASAMREQCAKACAESDKSTHPSDLCDLIRALPLTGESK